MENKRHLRIIETIDQGLREAEQIGIIDALNQAVEQGRMSIKEAEQCKEAYLAGRARDLGNLAVLPTREEPPDVPA
jgi:uncharacterized coiled-coil protein SlyX